MRYPVRLKTDDNGTYLVSFPDVPEAHTFGESKADALDHAQDALLTALDGYISNKRPIPTPSRTGKFIVEVPPLDVAKLELYEAMHESGTGKYRLAKKLGWHLPQVDRVLQLRYRSRFDQLEQALAVVGKRVVVSVENRPS